MLAYMFSFLYLEEKSFVFKTFVFVSLKLSGKMLTHIQACAELHAGSVNYLTRIKSGIKRNRMCQCDGALCKCRLSLPKYWQISSERRAQQHPHGISPPVAWLTLHRKCLPFTTHYLLLSPWLLHTGPGSSCPKLPSRVDSEHTLAQKMDTCDAKETNWITSVVSVFPIAASIPRKCKNLRLHKTVWLMWILQQGATVHSGLRFTRQWAVIFGIKLY